MLFIARRYLFSRKSRSVINIIAGVSLLSVAIPVAAVITLLSIFNGFGHLVEGMNEATDADLTIAPSRGKYFSVESIDTARLKLIEGVLDYAVVCEQTIMVEYEGREAVVLLRGVDDAFEHVTPIREHMRLGDFTLRLGELNRVVIGGVLAMNLGVYNLRGASVNLYSLRSSRLAEFAPYVGFESAKANISGIFSLDAQSEERYIYAPLRLSRELLGGEDIASSIAVKCDDRYDLKTLRKSIEGVVGDEYNIKSRQELNPLLYDIIRYEKWGIIFISCMVMLLASLSLIGVVAMLITEKREDMTTLRVLGATRKALRQIFFLQGMMLCKVGVACGVVVGVAVTLAQQNLGIVKLPAGAFLIDSYPVDLQFCDIATVVVIAVAIAATLNYIVTLRMIK